MGGDENSKPDKQHGQYDYSPHSKTKLPKLRCIISGDPTLELSIKSGETAIRSRSGAVSTLRTTTSKILGFSLDPRAKDNDTTNHQPRQQPTQRRGQYREAEEAEAERDHTGKESGNGDRPYQPDQQHTTIEPVGLLLAKRLGHPVDSSSPIRVS